MSGVELSLQEKVARFKLRSMRYVDVYVTNVFFPSNFYVRVTAFNQNDLDAVEVCGRPLRKDDLKLNKIVSYNSETLGKMIRGRICKIVPRQPGTKYNIHAIDYGFYDNLVSFRNIFDRGDDPQIPPLAYLCQLANCFPVGGSPWGEGATDAMRNLIGDSVVRMHVSISLENRLIVEMNLKATQTDVCQWLISNRFALSHYPNENEKPHPSSSYKEFTIKELEEGDVVTARVQTAISVEEFYVAKLEDYAEYLADREEFTTYCDEQEDMLPNEVLQGRAVGYRCPYEESYYERACILQVKNNGNKAVIQLIDWGDKMEVKHTDLKKLDFMKIRDKPAVAIYCSSVETEEWQHRLYQCLCPGFECVINVKRIAEDFSNPYVVEVNKKP